MTKNRYQQMVWVYKKRRSKLRERYGKRSAEYGRRAKPLTSKISIWNRQIKRIEDRNAKIKYIDKRICEFFCVTTMLNSRRTKNSVGLARRVFVKYCLENGVRSVDLDKYLGLKNACAKQRVRFTKSFNKHPESKKSYHKFVQYAKNR